MPSVGPNVLYVPKEGQLRDDAIRIMKEFNARHSLSVWPRNAVCLVTWVGEFDSPDYIRWYLSSQRSFTELAKEGDRENKLRRIVEQEFEGLATAWKAERGPTSSVAEMIVHPAYRKIVDMGQEVVPCLLRELEREPDHWFWALSEITRENPVRTDQEGKMSEMANAWVTWGQERGYDW